VGLSQYICVFDAKFGTHHVDVHDFHF